MLNPVLGRARRTIRRGRRPSRRSATFPPATERSVPQFLTRGTRDPLIPDAGVKEFADALVKAGQRVEYVQIGGASHAFFDWKPDDTTKATFAKYGVYYAAAMKTFFLSALH